MHSWQDFSCFVLSIYHVFHFLFLSYNSTSDIVLRVKDFFTTSFLSFIIYLSRVLLLEKTNLRSFSSHWEKCSIVGFCQVFFWGVGGMWCEYISAAGASKTTRSHKGQHCAPAPERHTGYCPSEYSLGFLFCLSSQFCLLSNGMYILWELLCVSWGWVCNEVCAFFVDVDRICWCFFFF